MKKGLRNIFAILSLVIIILIFKDEIKQGFGEIKKEIFPCKNPIEYSLGVFDKRFGVSEEYFLNAISKAERIWEETSGLDLFVYTKDGALEVNLAYDSRQEATQKLEEIGKVLNSDQEQYDALKKEYDDLRKEYFIEKEAFEKRIANFEARKQEFEATAEYWNKKGGAPQNEYQKLENERKNLNEEAKVLNSIQESLNVKIDEINALALAINQLTQDLNKKVDRFNDVADIHGEEFEEGNYERDSLGERINIYQFDSETKLVRVLAHELGHALGLGHVEDSDAIMYRLNDSTNQKATEADLSALKTLCKI